MLVGNLVGSILFYFASDCVLLRQVRVVGRAAVEVVRKPGPVHAVAADHAVRLGVQSYVRTRHLLVLKNIIFTLCLVSGSCYN